MVRVFRFGVRPFRDERFFDAMEILSVLAEPSGATQAVVLQRLF